MQPSGLSKRQIAELSEKLRQRYTALWRKVSVQGESAGPVEMTAVHDAQDDSWAEERDEELQAAMRHDRSELADIKQALGRLHNGNYGVCIDCGAAIGYARLEAYPTAKRCLSCQGTHERRPSRAEH